MTDKCKADEASIRHKVYHGVRTDAGCMVNVELNGHWWELNPAYHLRNHSPTGFQWGYGGSGPAQLALALLLDVTGDPETALQYYQRFKGEVVSHQRSDEWRLSEGAVAYWVRLQQAFTAEREKEGGQ